jgi:hypothetical protein
VSRPRKRLKRRILGFIGALLSEGAPFHHDAFPDEVAGGGKR